MATRIVLEVDFDLTPQDKEDLRYLISDALSDFRSLRDGDYVTRRYENRPIKHSADFIARKRIEVARRLDLASRLHNAALGHTVESVIATVDSDPDDSTTAEG